MIKKRILIFGAVAAPAIIPIIAGLSLLINSPRMINALSVRLQPFTGISLHVDNIRFTRRLEAAVQGLEVSSLRDKSFSITLASADIKAGITSGLDIVVERMVLTGPKFTFYMKNEKNASNPFAALEKVPPVRLLVIKDGRLQLRTETDSYSLPGVNLIVRDFRPDTGGHVQAKARFHVKSASAQARGSVEADLRFNRFSPQPSGSGAFRLLLDAAAYGSIRCEGATVASGLKLYKDTISFQDLNTVIRGVSEGEGKERASINDIKAGMSFTYDQRTSGFNLTSFNASGAGIGTLKCTANGTLKPFIWRVSVEATDIDLARIFALAQGRVPEEYRGWTFKGKGDVVATGEGRKAEKTVWSARAVVDLKEGGFVSADSSKAGEKITGKIELKMQSPQKGRKGIFSAAAEGADGEFLWGEYYQNFKGEKVRFASQGTFEENPFTLSSIGSADLFQSGDYAFSVNLSPESRQFYLKAQHIAYGRLYSVLLQNYIRQNYQTFQDMAVEGQTDLKVTLTQASSRTELKGGIFIRGVSLYSPSNRFLLNNLNASLPYDLSFPGPPVEADGSVRQQGVVSFDEVTQGGIRIGKTVIPIVFSGNSLIVSAPITISAFGGTVRMAGLRAESLFASGVRVETAAVIERLNLPELFGEAAPIPVAGMMDGNFSSIVFQNGKWTAVGGLRANVFGGQVIIENLLAGRIFSSSRFFEADARFDGIDLEAVTASIKVGKMSGLIKGSLKNFAMEYGQPSRFDLAILSDTSREAPQEISVDAIKNLSIISTGSGAISAILGSGLNRFFKEYPYSKIGIKCSLADDVFSLRGLIHEGGNEYLVRKAWFRGIDIVNQNPNNSISFKDMAERVGRIFQPRSKDSVP